MRLKLASLIAPIASCFLPALCAADLDDFLKPVTGSAWPTVCSYDGSKLTNSRAFEGGQVRTKAATWTCELRETPVKGQADARDLTATFKLTDGSAPSAGVAMDFVFADWSRDNYLLVPAIIYNGNRFHALGGAYMPPFPREMYFNPKLPLTIANNPRLSVEPGQASKIELLTGNAATPAICFYSPSKRRGFILLTEQRTRFGNTGLLIEENALQDRITCTVSAPGVRERAAHFGGFGPSGDAAADWKPGDDVTLKLRLYCFPADGIPALLEKFMAVRKSLSGPNQPRNLASMSKIRDMIVPRFKGRWMTVPAGSYYAPENSPHFQLGWVSGFMQTPMLAIDDPLEREHICRQIDFVVGKLQAASGFFYGGITSDGQLRPDHTFDSRRLALTRKNADALLMFFKFFQILKAQGRGDLIKPEWERSARRLAQAFVNAWKKSGEFGQYLDPATGEVAVYNTTGGAIAPAGLALAARYFNEPEFLRVAIAAADFYYRRDVAGLGLTSGHVGDTAQDIDSESAFGFLESLMALYWATGDRAWLDKARTEANLGATWVLSYDYHFPPQSEIGRLDGHMAGAVFANTQNKHAAPGICTASGDYLFKLYRATGDVRYAELIRDIQHAHVEATEMPGHPTCHAGNGASMERIQPSDAEGKGAVGNFYPTQNAWTELNNLMMALELPGVYLRTDKGNIFVFDHIEARDVRRDDAGVTMTLFNPTRWPASVTIFGETAQQAAQPLAYTAYLKWPRVELKAGESKEVTIDRRGRILLGSQRAPAHDSAEDRPSW
jgi:hypothetical protein